MLKCWVYTFLLLGKESGWRHFITYVCSGVLPFSPTLRPFHFLYDVTLTSCCTSPISYGARGRALSFYSACFHQSNTPGLSLVLHPSPGRGSDLSVWCIFREGTGHALLNLFLPLLPQELQSPCSSEPWFYRSGPQGLGRPVVTSSACDRLLLWGC